MAHDRSHPSDADAVIASLEEFAMSLPEAWIDTPWGDRVVKVGKKIFLFISSPGSERAVCTVKLPDSNDHGLSYPDASPTGYGLGKHGWVTIPVDGVPDEEREVLFDFVEESYRAVATKTLVKRLDAQIADDDATA
jgi:predicted DNA-binding protein (MmcQ/YjbR family)